MDCTLKGFKAFRKSFDEKGLMHLDLNMDGSLRVLAFATKEMLRLYNELPEILQMDGTYNITSHGLILFHMLITDSHLRGQTIFYAFVSEESGETIKRVVQIFVRFMSETSRTSTIVLDKDIREHNAIKEYLPNARILICQWHVMRAIKPQINKYVNKEDQESLTQSFK